MKMSSSKVAAATTALAITAVARASESADTGVTEMNAGIGTVGMLIGGVAAMGVVIWLLIKFLNRKK
ncbi:MAG TPA: hypothetical protein VFM53_03450 [Anaeromyxobacteraceae bacterium]|nr:hypothetical protein [Anaeromyxobacteraceae bacterium]